MTQEEKNLLHKDLCARLPYGVHVQHRHFSEPLQLTSMHLLELGSVESIDATLEDVKPYLFPLSSMTKKQKEELEDMNLSFDGSVINNIIEYLGNHRQFITHFDCSALIDWLNKNHFDYRGLIEKGLAIDATELNIY